MSARKWDDLGPDWTASVVAAEDHGPVHTDHPLTSRGGMHTLSQMIAAEAVWSNLTKPQRELVLSIAGECPVAARRDVVERIRARGLISGHSYGPWSLTAAGRLVVELRLPPRRSPVIDKTGESA